MPSFRTPRHAEQESRRVSSRAGISTLDVINQPIHDMDGVVFGRLSEIIFEAARGTAAFVVIDCDGGSQCALPFEMVHIGYNPIRLSARVRRDIFLH